MQPLASVRIFVVATGVGRRTSRPRSSGKDGNDDRDALKESIASIWRRRPANRGRGSERAVLPDGRLFPEAVAAGAKAFVGDEPVNRLEPDVAGLIKRLDDGDSALAPSPARVLELNGDAEVIGCRPPDPSVVP